MRFYNSLTHTKEDFSPLDPKNVTIYACGPTVYDRVHLGNARPIVVFDTLFRLMQQHFPQVTYARNITDVDDKINARAAQMKVSIQDLTEETTKQFHTDMAELYALPPTIEPRATQHIDEMIDMITALIDKGLAYEAEGHVLFAVNEQKNYGCLSRRNMDDMIAGARVEVAPYKKNPADFVLWKPSDEATPGWDSPWGFGRPGWHIECSAMSTKYLGTTFDIHAGGQDLIFPHHENEVAQSTGVHGDDTFAKTWMHNGMITVNGEKMSKSLGNFITVRDALDRMPGEVIRYVLLSAHYRQSLDWTDEAVEQSKTCLNRLYNALRGSSTDITGVPFSTDVCSALEDDLNTPLAISKLFELCSAINKESDETKKAQLQATLRASASLMGLLSQDAESWFKGNSTIDPDHVEGLIAARKAARANKDFAEADRLRAELDALDLILEDTPDGTIWRQK